MEVTGEGSMLAEMDTSATYSCTDCDGGHEAFEDTCQMSGEGGVLCSLLLVGLNLWPCQ